MHLQILDLDGSLVAQPSLRDAAPWTTVATIALRDLAPRLRLWTRAVRMRELRERLARSGATADDTISLLGSGDFHHLAVSLMERASEPFTLIHIDNHPDWVRLAPRWHCGSWVNRALQLARIAKVITLGVCSDDLVRPDLKGGNLSALSQGRIALFPWRHAPSRSWARVASGAGHRYEGGWIVWDNLADGDFCAHLETVVAQIATANVWITIDKDVLPESEVLSNWDQGQMPLARVLETIRTITARKRLVGADICGEYSPPSHTNLFKRFEARMDQPQRDVTATALAQNEQVNIALLRALSGVSR
jgi:arginase family enzyme